MPHQQCGVAIAVTVLYRGSILPRPQLTSRLPPQGDSPRAREIAALLAEKMTVLEKELRMAIAKKITEDFKDPLGPVNALSQAALAPLGKRGLIHKHTHTHIHTHTRTFTGSLTHT